MDGEDRRHIGWEIESEIPSHQRKVQVAHWPEVVRLETGIDQSLEKQQRGPRWRPLQIVQLVVLEKAVVSRMVQTDEEDGDDHARQQRQERVRSGSFRHGNVKSHKPYN